MQKNSAGLGSPRGEGVSCPPPVVDGNVVMVRTPSTVAFRIMPSVGGYIHGGWVLRGEGGLVLYARLKMIVTVSHDEKEIK